MILRLDYSLIINDNNMDFINAFYNSKLDRNNFFSRIDSLLSSETLFVYAIPFACEHDFLQLVNNVKSKSLKLIKSADGIHLFSLKHIVKKKNESIEGKFFLYELQDQVNCKFAITMENNQFFHRVLKPFIDSLKPHVITTFITHSKLKELLINFQSVNKFTDLRILRASQKIRFIEPDNTQKIVSEISWPSMSLEEAFNWVAEKNGWFKSLQFEALYGNRVFADVYLTRQGILKTNQGFTNITEAFLKPITKLLYENIQQFKNRGRKERQDLTVRPIMIDFGKEQFDSIEENQKFIFAIKQFCNSSVSVLHGNPYVHISIMDYIDGSSFDVMISNSDRLMIIPQLKASAFSIKRLVNHIFDFYAEGKIRDYIQNT